MKSGQKWVLIGTGAVGAVGLAALGVGLSCRYMVRLAMDRETPAAAKRDLDRVSGGGMGPMAAAMLACGKSRLERAGAVPVETESHDGLRLVGHWLEVENPKRVIVAMHGWRGSWARDFGLISEFWREQGCSVLFAEQRGQGESGGKHIGFGLLERHDCLRWVRWVCENQPGLPVYLAGVSMGATTVLMAGGMELPETVRGILADCGYTSAHDIWKHVAEHNLHLRYSLYAAAANDLCRRRIDLDARDYSTLDAMAECEVPVLFVHGTDDSFVPISMTFENYKACAAPKRLLVVPGAEHAMSYLTDRPAYEKAMLEFWEAFDRGADSGQLTADS